MNNKYIYISSILLIIFVIFNINTIIDTIPINLLNFIKYTFPPLFISMMISKLLMELNIQYYLSKIIKNYSLRLMILSFITGFPNNILFIINDYKNNLIKEKDINYLICFTTVVSPIYLINQSFKLFNQYSIYIIIIYYLTYIIIFIILNKKIKVNNVITNKKNINIKDFIIKDIPSIFYNLINICSIIIFFQMFTSIIDNPLLKGIIEFTSGINNLYIMNYPLIKKEIIFEMILLFSSLSMFTQLSYYLKDYKINYKLFVVIKTLILIVIAMILLAT